MGLALGIVLECDLIVAAAGTKFQVTETSRGLRRRLPIAGAPF
jgi:enoyl-CoA hydratase/carnithine racemase